MKKFRLLNLFCLCEISLLIWSSAAAQDQEQEEALHHEVTVTLKLIQVYVSTKDGLPVQALTEGREQRGEGGYLLRLEANTSEMSILKKIFPRTFKILRLFSMCWVM